MTQPSKPSQRDDAAATEPGLRRFVGGQTQRGVLERGERPFEGCILWPSVGARRRGDDLAKFGHEGHLVAPAQPGQIGTAKQVGHVVARQHLTFTQAGCCRNGLLQMIGLTAALDAQGVCRWCGGRSDGPISEPEHTQIGVQPHHPVPKPIKPSDHLGQTLQVHGCRVTGCGQAQRDLAQTRTFQIESGLHLDLHAGGICL